MFKLIRFSFKQFTFVSEHFWKVGQYMTYRHLSILS